MRNPFVYGAIVTGTHFVNRDQEIREITAGLLGGQHIILYSPRKMGKSSLIEEVFRRINESGAAYAVRINLQKTETKEALSMMLINETVRKTYSSIEKLAKEMKELFKRIDVRLSVDKDGKIGIEPTFGETREILEDALDFPEKVSEKKGKRMIIAFDEFQEMRKYDGIEMERLFRATIEDHRSVSYIFTGSERHLISLIFEDCERPFYRFARFMELGPIREDQLRNFIVKKFNETNKNITDDALDYVITFSEGIPFYAQCLCHEAWYLSEREVDTAIVEEALTEKILPALSPGFEIIWGKIRSEVQRKLLLAMAWEDKNMDYRRRLIERYGLRSSSHVRKAARAMESMGLIYQMRIADFLFREWIKRYKTF